MKTLIITMMFIACICMDLSAADTASTATTKVNPAVVTKKITDTGASKINPGTAANGARLSTVTADTVARKITATVDCRPPSEGRKWLGWALIVLIVTLFTGAAVKSNLLRDAITNPDEFLKEATATPKYARITDIDKIPKPYSLARSQLGVWTVVISCSYIYLMLCKFFPMQGIDIDKTIIALMGISAGTTAAGSIIDNNNPGQPAKQVPSEGFIRDIISDQNGVNIHRFQNVIWTIIAVVIFLAKVPEMVCGQLPSLDHTLIALTGISTATYLGLKINENKAPALTATQPPVPPPGNGS